MPRDRGATMRPSGLRASRDRDRNPGRRGKSAATPRGKSVDGFMPGTTAGGSVCKIGAGDVLTDPAADACRRRVRSILTRGATPSGATRGRASTSR